MKSTIIYTVITGSYDSIKQPKGQRREWSIYLDADMVIKRPPTELVAELHNDTLFAACRYSYCTSVEEEITDLVKKKMSNAVHI